jgi:hypothetical protein
MKWFRAWATFNSIEEVEIEKFTDASVWIGGRRHARLGWQSYFQTWSEAKDYLIAEAEQAVVIARRVLEHAQGKLGNAKGMKAPSPVSEGG